MKKIIILTLILGLLGCKKSSDDITFEDTAEQQVGEVMVSIDEMGGVGGSFSLQSESAEEMSAQATCGAATWSTCTNNVKTRTFASCSLGRATLSGSVTFTYIDAASDSTCSIPVVGNNVSRAPNFTIQGARGGIVSVTTTGSYGQKVTRTGANTFQFTSDGINRKLTYGGTTYADYSTTTVSAVSITGNSRNNRVVNGGSLQIENNISGEICTFVPSTVTYTSACNCAESGSWNYVCDAGSGTGTISLTGCGTADLTVNSSTVSVVFDRCQSI